MKEIFLLKRFSYFKGRAVIIMVKSYTPYIQKKRFISLKVGLRV